MRPSPSDELLLRLAAMPPPLVVRPAAGVRPITFRPIPPGRFRMGSREGGTHEQPPHLVEITASPGAPPGTPAFWMGDTPVTQAQFAVWTSAEAYAAWFEREARGLGLDERHANWIGPERGGGPDHPAEQVTWHEAVAFCEWLTAADSVPAGWHASLPSEAQWEFACRAGTTTEYWSGDGEAALAEVGWYEGNYGRRTHPVGEKPANAFGLHDVHGNVWEWCRDVWDAGAFRRRADGVRDPLALSTAEGGATSDPLRVVRGGSWDGGPWWCRSSCRGGRGPSNRDWGRGFRVCLLPGPVATGSTGTGDRAQADGGGAEGGVEPTGEPPEGAGAGVGPDLSAARLPRRPRS